MERVAPIVRLKRIHFFDFFLFLYFVTLHADQLSLAVGGLTVRWNNLIAIFLLTILFCRYRLTVLQIDRNFVLGLIAFLFSVILSLSFSSYPERCAQFLGWSIFTVICYAILPYLLLTLFDVAHIFKLYISSFFVVGAYAAIQLIGSLMGFFDPFAPQVSPEINGTFFLRPNAFSYEPSFYALYMTPFICLITFLFFSKRVPLLLFLGAHALFLVSTSTSTVFVYLTFFLLIIGSLFIPSVHRSFPQLKRQIRQFIFGLVVVLGLFYWVAPNLTEMFYLKFAYSTSHHSFEQRMANGHNAWQLFLQNPSVGAGLGAYPNALFDAWSKGEGNYSFSYQIELLHYVKNPLKLFEPQITGLELLASLGLCGVIPLMFLLWGFIKNCWRAFSSCSSEEQFWKISLTISTIVMLCLLQINQGLLRTYIWTQCSFTYAYICRVARQQ